jgi:hypothetical protein
VKIADGYILRCIANTWVVIPVGAKLVEFNGIINLTESGAFLWKKLEAGASSEQLASALVEVYEVDESTALADVEAFLQQLHEKQLLQ